LLLDEKCFIGPNQEGGEVSQEGISLEQKKKEEHNQKSFGST
jgi:hypothetical protein